MPPASTIDYLVTKLRDPALQKAEFNNCLKQIGNLYGYEISKDFNFASKKVKTMLGEATGVDFADEIVIATVLRAGLPLQAGLAEALPNSQQAFIAASRNHDMEGKIGVDLAYVATPSLKGKVLILADTMIATGNSFVAAHRALVKKGGKPKQVIIVGVIASQEGLEKVKCGVNPDKLHIAAVDPNLNSKKYIVPGLGDAGDRLYGPKI